MRSYSYNDVDLDSDSSTISWTVASTQTGSGTVVGSGSVLTSNNFVRDQWVTCSVTANDGQIDGNSDSDQVQIENTAPVVSNASIAPSAILASTSSVACNYAYTDADSDPDSSVVRWYKNDALSHTGPTYSGPFAAGNRIFCTVTANDGTDDGNTTTSSTIIVDNTAPVVSNVSITPIPPITGMI